MNNTDVFKDTQNIIECNNVLQRSLKNSIDNSAVYNENFFSAKTPFFEDSSIWTEESLTLISARECAQKGNKTAVLNFANPVEPGGGVWRGANAQEEYLCRASYLYNCLCASQNAQYYNCHREMQGENGFGDKFMSTDKVIYIPDVVVFKEDCGYVPGKTMPFTQEYTEEWFKIDVLTCAAPYFGEECTYPSEKELKPILKKRIKNILEVAVEHKTESLILGAFGCGAFSNPPEIVADSFKEVLEETRYKNAFREVIFAIKRNFTRCRVLTEFENRFNKADNV